VIKIFIVRKQNLVISQ